MNGRDIKILFLSYTYPPAVVGGIETYMLQLIGHFREFNPETHALVNTRGLKFLPLFIPYSIIRALLLIRRHGITHLHAASGPHCFQALLLKKLTGVKTSITIHGLDIINRLFFLDRITPFFLRRLDLVFCVSRATRKECISRGIDENSCVAIHNGVDPDVFPLHRPRRVLRKELEAVLHIPLRGKKILVTNGRLIRRKGVEWFVDACMPRLDKSFLYLVSGDGPDREAIVRAIARHGLQERVLLLGRTSFDLLRLIYNCADRFIMPNRRVPGTMEGFGLVILEAGSCGVPVVASDIEGISDAVIHGTTGWLVPELDADAFIRHVKKPPLPAGKMVRAIREKYDWDKITRRYRAEMAKPR